MHLIQYQIVLGGKGPESSLVRTNFGSVQWQYGNQAGGIEINDPTVIK